MSIDRRMVLASAAAVSVAAGVGFPALTAHAQAAAPAGQAPGFYRYKVGDITVTAINDGFAMRPLDGFIRNAQIADVTKALETAFLPTNALAISFTTLVLSSSSGLTLIDTGNGEFGAPTSGRWMANFRAAGFDPKDVNRIVYSHFHGDHINGTRGKDGALAFPNAELMVPAAEWAFWMDDARMAAAPDAMKGAFQNVRRVFGPVAKDVKPFDAGKLVAPGITSIASYGHTPGHTTFMIESGGQRLLSLADTANHPALFVRNPDWSAIFDMNADEARATRRKLLEMAASERTQVAFYHAPFPATGFIAKDGAGFQFVPAQWTPAV